jgi:hypothetical protein
MFRERTGRIRHGKGYPSIFYPSGVIRPADYPPSDEFSDDREWIIHVWMKSYPVDGLSKTLGYFGIYPDYPTNRMDEVIHPRDLSSTIIRR